MEREPTDQEKLKREVNQHKVQNLSGPWSKQANCKNAYLFDIWKWKLEQWLDNNKKLNYY